MFRGGGLGVDNLLPEDAAASAAAAAAATVSRAMVSTGGDLLARGAPLGAHGAHAAPVRTLVDLRTPSP